MPNVTLEWVLPESCLDGQVRAIEVSGGTVEDSGTPFRPRPEEAGDYQAAGFEPLTIIAATASVVFLAQAIQKLIRDHPVRGATIVDVRDGKLRIRPVPSMPSGRLVVVQDSGVQVFDKQDQDTGRKLLTEVLSQFGG